jgi:hypothetical protein
MGFISFLKSAGKVLANVAALEAGIEPIFKAAMPATMGPGIDKLDLIFKNVIATEGMFSAAFPAGQTGAQKVVAAASLLGPILSTVDTVRGQQIADEAAYVKAVQTIAGGVADLLNAYKATDNKTVPVQALPAPATAVALSAPAPAPATP